MSDDGDVSPSTMSAAAQRHLRHHHDDGVETVTCASSFASWFRSTILRRRPEPFTISNRTTAAQTREQIRLQARSQIQGNIAEIEQQEIQAQREETAFRRQAKQAHDAKNDAAARRYLKHALARRKAAQLFGKQHEKALDMQVAFDTMENNERMVRVLREFTTIAQNVLGDENVAAQLGPLLDEQEVLQREMGEAQGVVEASFSSTTDRADEDELERELAALDDDVVVGVAAAAEPTAVVASVEMPPPPRMFRIPPPPERTSASPHSHTLLAAL